MPAKKGNSAPKAALPASRQGGQEKKPASFRTPIVAVMGHVDHGKTSILDAIRGARVAEGEHGGITQNTRAHQIVTKAGNRITFIDTPGHEAFSAMRARGAKVTDFVMLVVAADDGVQNQTKESIKFAQESNVPIIVVINKVDMPGAEPARVKRELASFGLNVEEFGGEAMVFEVSAKTKQGIDDLIEGIELLAEVKELRPNTVKESSLGEAFVLESSLDKRLGPVALCVLKAGRLSGRVVGATTYGTFRVRAFLNEFQKPVEGVSESDPFWITGLKQPAETGDRIYFASDEKTAENLVEEIQVEESSMGTTAGADGAQDLLLELIAQREAVKQGVEQKVLNVVVKASSKGTLEAVEVELAKMGDDEKKVRILLADTGEVTENDIKTAQAAGGIVVSFQQPLSSKVEAFAKQEKVIVRNYEIIYEMVDELSGALEGLIEPEEQEVEIARAKIKQVFELTDGDIVAGCEVTKGTMTKGYRVYVERPSESTKDAIAEVARGKIKSLRLRKEEVREAKKGQECGILVDPKPSGIQEGDEVVAYKVEK